MLPGVWKNNPSYSLLVKVKTSTTSVEGNLTVSFKIANTLDPANPVPCAKFHMYNANHCHPIYNINKRQKATYVPTNKGLVKQIMPQ